MQAPVSSDQNSARRSSCRPNAATIRPTETKPTPSPISGVIGSCSRPTATAEASMGAKPRISG
jgi:hypothetical protein